MKSTSNIIDTIDEVYNMTLESDISVVDAMGTACYKAGVIMENYGGDDYESLFAIFQEEDTTVQDNTASVDAAAKKEAEEAAQKNDPKKSGPLWFLINIFRKIAQWFKDAWNGKIVPTFNRAIGKAEQTEVKEEHVPLLQAIFEKSLDWIKEHKAQLGIGAAGIMLIAGFKIILNRMNDNSRIKQAILSLYKSIGITVTVPFKIWTWTLKDKMIGLFTDFSFTKLKEFFTKDIPEISKATKDAVDLAKDMKNGEVSSEKYMAALNNYNNLIAKMAKEKNEGTPHTVTPTEIKDAFNAVTEARKGLTEVMNTFTIKENEVTPVKNDFIADVSNMLNKLDEKYNKGTDGLMKCLEKTTVIGGAVGSVMTFFQSLTKDIDVVETEVVSKLGKAVDNGAVGADEYEQVTTEPDDFSTNKGNYYYKAKEDGEEVYKAYENNKNFDPANCWKPKQPQTNDVKDEASGKTEIEYEQVTTQPDDFDTNKGSYYKKSADENGKEVYAPYGADESFIPDNCYKVKSEQPAGGGNTDDGTEEEQEIPENEQPGQTQDQQQQAQDQQQQAQDQQQQAQDQQQQQPKENTESYYEDSTDDVISESWYNKF